MSLNIDLSCELAVAQHLDELASLNSTCCYELSDADLLDTLLSERLGFAFDQKLLGSLA